MEIEHNKKIVASGYSTMGKHNDPELKAYQELANAIIIQAVKDYREGYGQKSIERFFLSDFFAVITNINGEWLLEKLKSEIKK